MYTSVCEEKLGAGRKTASWNLMLVYKEQHKLEMLYDTLQGRVHSLAVGSLLQYE